MIRLKYSYGSNAWVNGLREKPATITVTKTTEKVVEKTVEKTMVQTQLQTVLATVTVSRRNRLRSADIDTML